MQRTWVAFVSNTVKDKTLGWLVCMLGIVGEHDVQEYRKWSDIEHDKWELCDDVSHYRDAIRYVLRNKAVLIQSDAPPAWDTVVAFLSEAGLLPDENTRS